MAPLIGISAGIGSASLCLLLGFTVDSWQWWAVSLPIIILANGWAINAKWAKQ